MSGRETTRGLKADSDECDFCRKHGEGSLCSACTQRLLALSPEQAEKEFNRAMATGQTKKAYWLGEMCEKEIEDYDPNEGTFEAGGIDERGACTEVPGMHKGGLIKSQEKGAALCGSDSSVESVPSL